MSDGGALQGWTAGTREAETARQEKDPRRRRRRRQALTFTALVSIVMLAGVLAAGQWLQWWTFGETYKPAAAVPCPQQTTVAPRRVSVNVFNATGKFGLARSVAAELQARGFRVTQIATDDTGIKMPGAVIIRHGPERGAEARTLAAQVADKVTVQADKRGDTSLDLIVGPAYRGMIARPQASKAIAQIPRPEGCVTATTPPPVG